MSCGFGFQLEPALEDVDVVAAGHGAKYVRLRDGRGSDRIKALGCDGTMATSWPVEGSKSDRRRWNCSSCPGPTCNASSVIDQQQLEGVESEVLDGDKCRLL